MSLRTLVLWRHGETEYNVAGRIQGHLDVELNEAGLRQARTAAVRIAAFNPDIVLSSDLRRAADTAAAFTTISGQAASPDKRLRETHLGLWQGLSGSEVEERWPGAMHHWRAQPTWAPPGGESRVEVAARAAEVVAELDRDRHASALLCTHGGLIGAVTARLLELPLEYWPAFGGIGNCNWTVLGRKPDRDNRWRVITYNGGTGP